jgi:hypothetical protein
MQLIVVDWRIMQTLDQLMQVQQKIIFSLYPKFDHGKLEYFRKRND